MDDLSEMESPAKRLYISKEKNGENELKWPPDQQAWMRKQIKW